MQAIRTGVRAEVVARKIDERTGQANRHAGLIARDQIGKFYGSLNKARQEHLGVDRYTWRTMSDNRVRLEHYQRNGTKYAWSSPPEDGHPGHPINCRCWADPDVSALLASL